MQHFDVFNHIPQIPDTSRRIRKPFQNQFIEDGISVCVDARIKSQEEVFRVWMARKPLAFSRRYSFDLPIEITGDHHKASEVKLIVVDMAIENIEGIEKGRLGRGVFQSLTSSDSPYLSPPFWWATSFPLVDASTKHSQCINDGGDGALSEASDLLYRHRSDDGLIRAINLVRWQITSDGFAVETRDSGLELIDALFGPLNGR